MARNAGVHDRFGANAARRAFSFRFIGDAISELRRVTWPTRQETMRLTIMVIAISVAIGAFLGLADIAFSKLLGVVLGK